jgi:hypothetical protein
MFCSCSKHSSAQKDNYENLNVAFDSDGLPEPQIVSDPIRKKIAFVTDTLFKGDTLTIKFKTPHSRDLGIITPDNKFFFLVYGFNDPKKPSLVDWNEFADIDTLQIITDKTKANPWNASVTENQIIFTKTGSYEILLSENLETDDGTPFEIDTVYYINMSRKK